MSKVSYKIDELPPLTAK